MFPRSTKATADHRGAAVSRFPDRNRAIGPHWQVPQTLPRTAASHRRLTPGRNAHKGVGLGTSGCAATRLLEGSSPDDVVFLKLKQARGRAGSLRPRLLRRHGPSGPAGGDYHRPCSRHDPSRLDECLRGESYAAFRNMKGTIRLTRSSGCAGDYAGIVGTSRQGPARTSGASMIAGYVGPSASSTAWHVRHAYADQTRPKERRQGVRSVRLPCSTGRWPRG